VLDDVLRYLACPYCGAGLTRTGSALHCARGHAFNVARQGYASLLPKKARGEGGDTAAMVQARADFLAAGHFADLAAEVAGTAAEAITAAAADGAGAGADAAGAGAGAGAADAAGAGCVVESGAGTGYYLARVLDALPGRAGVALDRSRYALRRAARAHERIGAVACDVWRRLPVADSAAVLALNVFAPRNGAELRRILDPAGRLVVVTPDDDHLRELAGALGLLSVDEHKQERLAGKLGPYFDLAGQREYRGAVELGQADVLAAAQMGPAAWHTDEADLAARVRSLPEQMTATVSVRVSVFRPSA
jgi:23S rRNA (guanine745-N1)-methyltransferase